MIVVKVFGGLGNQMFQYAAARQVAVRLGTEVALDLRWFDTQTHRSFALGPLAIRAMPAGEEQLAALPPPEWTGAGLAARLRSSLRARAHGQRLLVERSPGLVDERLRRARDGSCLIGYWQSERYFAPIRDRLRRELQLTEGLPGEAEHLAAEMARVPSVSLHVRRGDYVTTPEVRELHGTCTVDYYRAAMALLDEQLDHPVYFAFSDDPEWVESSFQHPKLRVVSSPDRKWSDHVELALMSRCSSHIVANSSFSWWGAWLGENPRKTVVAPRRWFSAPHLRSDDIVPPSWTRV